MNFKKFNEWLQRIPVNPVLPILLYIASYFLAGWIAHEGNCPGHEMICWKRWDSALYLQIAEKGHDLFFCGNLPGYDPANTDWCGNAGWMPLYPWLIKTVHAITAYPLEETGWLIAQVFYVAFLIAMMPLLELKKWNWKTLGLGSVLIIFPGNIYWHAIFPLSQVCFFAAMLILWVKKERYGLAGIFGALAIMSYGIGFFMLPAIAGYGIAKWYLQRVNPIPFIIQCFGISLCGLLIIFAYDQWTTGHWDAMFLIQRKYGHAFKNPLSMLSLRWQILFKNPFSLQSWEQIQNVFMCGYALILPAVLWINGWKNKNPLYWFAAIWIFIFWWVPFSLNIDVALYRNVALLAPMFWVFKDFSLRKWVFIIPIFAIYAYHLGVLFIYSKIV